MGLILKLGCPQLPVPCAVVSVSIPTTSVHMLKPDTPGHGVSAVGKHLAVVSGIAVRIKEGQGRPFPPPVRTPWKAPAWKQSSLSRTGLERALCAVGLSVQVTQPAAALLTETAQPFVCTVATEIPLLISGASHEQAQRPCPVHLFARIRKMGPQFFSGFLFKNNQRAAGWRAPLQL